MSPSSFKIKHRYEDCINEWERFIFELYSTDSLPFFISAFIVLFSLGKYGIDLGKIKFGLKTDKEGNLKKKLKVKFRED